MTPEEKLQRVTEEQKILRDRLTQLDAQIAVLRSEFRQAPEASISPITANPEGVAMPDERGYWPEPESASVSVAPVTPAIIKAPAGPPPLPPVTKAAVVPEEVVPQSLKVPPQTPALSRASGANILPPRPVAAEKNAEVLGAQPAPPPLVGGPPVVVAKPVKKGFEQQFGQVWAVRIGVGSLLTGLILGSIYAYQNFVHQAPAILKVLALYLISGGLLGAGLWLEKSRESLRTFGRVIAAGGFAALYYTTYAMHHVERLQVISSPIVGGLLLLLCAMGIFAYADWKKDQTVAAMSLVLGYYGTAISPVGWFSLFSNGVLTAGGLWLLWRHRWIALGVLSLVGSYGGFAFWQYALPLFTTGQLAPMAYWAGQGFLMGCWVLFTAVFLLAQTEVVKMPIRASLAALNNAAFFALFMVAMIARIPAAERTDPFAAYTLIWGAVLLGLCWAAEKVHGKEGRPLSEVFLAFGLIEIAIGLVIKLSGYQVITVFALKAALLAWVGMKLDRRTARVASVLCAAFVILLTLAAHSSKLDKWIPGSDFPALLWSRTFAAIAQLAFLFLGGWLLQGEKRLLLTQAKVAESGAALRFRASWQSAVFCIGVILIWFAAFSAPTLNWGRYMSGLGFCTALIAATVFLLPEFKEMRRVATVFAFLTVLPLIYREPTSGSIFEFWSLTPFTVSVTAVVCLGIAWLCKKQPWLNTKISPRAPDFCVEAFAFAAIALFAWADVVVMPMDEWWKPTALLLVCGGLALLGHAKAVGLPELALTARIGGMVGAGAIVWFGFLHAGRPDTWKDILGAVLNTGLLVGAAWLGRHRTTYESGLQKSGLFWIALYYSAAAVLSFLFIVCLPLDRVWQPAVWVLLCAALMALGKASKVSLPELSLCAGIAALFQTYYQIGYMGRPPQMAAEGWLMLSFFALAGAATLKPQGWPDNESAGWLKFLRWSASLQLMVSYLVWWYAHEPAYFTLATAALALLLAGFSRWKSGTVPGGISFVLGALAIVTFIFSAIGVLRLDAPVAWGWAVPVLVMAAEWLLRGHPVAKDEEALLACRGLAVACVFALWHYLTYQVLEHGSYRTMTWAGFALLLFVVGLVLQHSTYRRCGLAVLGVALGRIVFYDVWQLETAARFITFLVIGAVLVLLGFFYNRFEDLLKKYW